MTAQSPTTPPTATLGIAAPLLATVYSIAATLAEPALRLMLARRLASGREIAARLPERRGIDPTLRPPGTLLWVHAASVGETISVLPVLHALAQAQPKPQLLLTTGTVTAAAIATERLPPGALHRFIPLDVPRWAARFLDHWRPDLACFVESEVWPNLLAAIGSRGIPAVLLNARLSDASFRAWRRVSPLARRLFAGFRLIHARSPADAARLAQLAGRPVASPGDLKFAAPPLPADPATLAALRHHLHGRPTWIAASLHPGEDAIVIAAHRLLAPRHPGLVTILAPRHPRRAAAMVAATAMPRRSLGQWPDADGPHQASLYCADTLGELGVLYRAASCALLGGSLIPHGGQNPLEAARLGLPVAIGPHADNFAQACTVLHQAGGLTTVTDAASIAAWADTMLADPAAAAAAGAAGKAAAQRWADLPVSSARALLDLLA